MSSSSTPDLFRKSREHLLSPRPRPRTDQVLVEVSYQGPNHTPRASARLKPQPLQRRDNDSGDQQSSLHHERHLMKNMVILGISFVFVFSAFNALQSLQSSLFTQTGLGLQAFAVVYGLMTFSCLYGPTFVEKLTPNWTIVLSFVMFALFMSTFFYPRPYTLFPSAILLGLSMGPLFAAQTTFMMILVSKMSCLTDKIRDKIYQRFLHMFYLFLNSGRIWGNLVTGLLLHYSGDIYIYTNHMQTNYRNVDYHYLPDGSEDSTQAQSKVIPSPGVCTTEGMCPPGAVLTNTSLTVYIFQLPSHVSLMLVSVYLGLALVGVAIVTTLLDKPDMYIFQDPLERSPWFRTVRDIAKSLVDSQFVFIIPMALFIGIEQGFIAADFTKSYVSCSLGLEAVGYTMMSLGTMNTAGSLAVHQFSKHIQRPLILAAGLVCHFGLLLVLWLWRPVRDDVAIFYVISAGWGLCNAVWETLTVSYLASVYADRWQAPFAAYYMTLSIGLTIAFGSSFYICTEIKIYAMTVLLATAGLAYSVLEYRFHNQRKMAQEQSGML